MFNLSDPIDQNWRRSCFGSDRRKVNKMLHVIDQMTEAYT